MEKTARSTLDNGVVALLFTTLLGLTAKSEEERLVRLPSLAM